MSLKLSELFTEGYFSAPKLKYFVNARFDHNHT